MTNPKEIFNSREEAASEMFRVFSSANAVSLVPQTYKGRRWSWKDYEHWEKIEADGYSVQVFFGDVRDFVADKERRSMLLEASDDPLYRALRFYKILSPFRGEVAVANPWTQIRDFWTLKRAEE